MKKAGIILIFLLAIVFISFLHSPSIEKHASEPVIVTKKIPRPEPEKVSKEVKIAEPGKTPAVAKAKENPAKSSDCELETNIYFLHVSSYKQNKYAEEQVQKMKEHASQVVAILEDVQGESWFRVYMGEFENENKARKFGAKLKAKGLISYFKPVSIDMIIQPPRQPAARSAQKSASLIQPEEPPPPPEADKPKSMQQPKHDQEKPEQLEAKAKLPLVIDDITFRAKNGTKELVLFHANRYFMPSVHFNLEGKNPTIAIDIEPPATIKKAGSKIPIDGQWIKQIHIKADADNKTSRIVVHLYAYKNYKVSQSFYRSEKIFAIKVISE